MRNASSKSSNLALDDNLKYFDLIGFDPRGVNNSTPHLHCFPDSIARQIWDAQASAEGLFESSDDSFDLMWARAKALGQACSDDGTGIAQFMNTPVVVADMVAIIERHGEWREQEARLLLERAEDMSSDKTGVILERTRWKRGEEVLQYWGFSYGTILGQTFAALQPSRVSRLVLDGVVDIGDYYRGDWMKNLLLADQIVGKFYEYCHRAGPSNCAFYSGSSARDIKKRLHNLLGVIKENPVFIGTSETYGPKIFTYSDVMLEIRESLYEPLDRFPQIATLLAALASPLSRSSVEVIAGYKFRADYRITHKSSGDGVFVPTGIFCSDGPDLTSTNKSSLLAYAEPLAAQSKYVGASWITHRLECSGWVTRPRWEFDYRNAGGKTRHPILFVGNTLDPVTPLSNAHENAAMWEGSGVLEVRGEGHCTYAVESACTNRVIGRYFQTGDMPERGKVCEVDRKPFEAKN
jgi:pimeloyl-ACP methyl ester carboxylesterase